MRLDRNINGTGRGKYGLVKNRELKEYTNILNGYSERVLAGTQTTVDASTLEAMRVMNAISLLEDFGIIDWGETPETEFFVMKLKDRYARGGLYGYSNAAYIEDHEYAMEVEALAERAGPLHPLCKKPD